MIASLPRLSAIWPAVLLLAAPSAAQQELGAPAEPLSPRNASYRIEARLDPAEQTLTGRQTISWTNIQDQPTDELWLHLYWNAWRNDQSSWMREDSYRGRSDLGDEVEMGDWGYTEVASIRLPDGQDLTRTARFEAPDDGNTEDRTLMVVPLPEPVAPGETVELELEWRSKVPRTFARTGFRGDYYFVAHWFPKVAVFEGDGWNAHQYHAATEYFSDYGVYDVRLTVPTDFVVGATGREVERRDNGDGTATHHYYQEDVHAFTWTASADYLDLRRRFEAPGLPPVDMRLLLQPEHEGQADRHFAATAAALELYGRWYGPYPYGHVTVVDPAYGSGAGGMEYPTIFTAGTRLFNPFGGGSPEGVTVHEAGHQFWYGLVGNDEFTSAWLDEGLNTFSTGRVMWETYGPSAYLKRYFVPPGTEQRGFLPLLFDDIREPGIVSSGRLASYRRNATSDVPARPTWQYHPQSAGSLSYSKTALWLTTLENHLGWDRLQPIMSTFFERWKFRHPRPEDLLAVFDEMAGEDLGWFFDQVFYDDVRFDYGIESVKSHAAEPSGFLGAEGALEYREKSDEDDVGRYRNEVVVRRHGEGTFPVEVLMIFEDGNEVRREWDGLYRWHRFVEEGPAKLSYAVVDPRRVLVLDADFTNNSRRREEKNKLPAVKWGSKWLVWFQDLLATFATFV
jgi:hypothetical protein